MKRYRLIKEYPGSVKLNTIIQKQTEFSINYMYKIGCNLFQSGVNNPENYPEFWEEVVEKDYEILSLYTKYNSHILKKPFYNIPNLLEQGCKINSVKRLSDGEVFTVGNKIEYEPASNRRIKRVITSIIKKFYIDLNNKLRINFDLDRPNIDTNSYLEKISKVKKPLFTTDFKILSFKSPDFNYILEYLPEKDKYANDFKQVSLENCLKYYNIQSVKRISDNVIFKIGDYIEEGRIINIIIKNFKIYLEV